MDMDMENRLSGRGADINAYIETGDGRVFFFDFIFQDPDQVIDIVSLGCRKTKIIIHMTSGENQVVSRCDRISIQNRNRVAVCVYNLSR
jgi:hypothetical protein